MASATDDGSHGSHAAAPLDSSGSSVGGMVAKHKAALPCKKCKKCRKCPECERWAHVGSAVGADKYGAQYFALCTAVKVRRLARDGQLPWCLDQVQYSGTSWGP